MAEELLPMYKNLSMVLLENGVRMAKNSFKNIPQEQNSFGFLKTALVGAGIDAPLTEMDTTYRFISWNAWLEILNYLKILISKIPWIMDFCDCDNLAYFFSSLIAVIFGINTGGEGFGQVKNVATQQFLFMHHFNVIITPDEKVYLYDPTRVSGGKPEVWVEIKKGLPIILGDWEYRIDSLKFF